MPETASTVAAVIGAVTSVIALLLSYVTHRQVQRIKALDLRVELRKEAAEVKATINDLPDLLNRARTSRDHVLSALGTLLTGHHEQWLRSMPPGSLLRSRAASSAFALKKRMWDRGFTNQMIVERCDTVILTSEAADEPKTQQANLCSANALQ